MTIVLLKYTLMIATSIRKARQQRAITQSEADYLCAMSQDSSAASVHQGADWCHGRTRFSVRRAAFFNIDLAVRRSHGPR